MNPSVVVDIGNSRTKWGRVVEGGVRSWVSLPPDSPESWNSQIARWNIVQSELWTVAGVQPTYFSRFTGWLAEKGQKVERIQSWQQLALSVKVEQPERVGLDRLFNAVAANRYRKTRRPAMIIDAGSAVTVDYVDETGAFDGGAILPGFRLMAQSLHEYTAQLPLLKTPAHADHLPLAPGTSTAKAIELGLYWSIIGAICFLIMETGQNRLWQTFPHVFLTGGDAALLEPELSRRLTIADSPFACLPQGETVHLWPTMTLEGILAASENLP